MAHGHLRALAAGLASLAALSGCGATASSGASAAQPQTRGLGYAAPDEGWGRFTSRRFQLTLALPDGRAWKIDDHSGAELVATHAPTRSRLTLAVTEEDQLMSRARCEERARARGWLGTRTLTTVEDEAATAPGPYDSRVWVALDPSQEDLTGHVFLFGGSLRRCLIAHLETRVPPSEGEATLAQRLAVGAARIVKGIQLLPPRTTDEAAVPRERPTLRR